MLNIEQILIKTAQYFDLDLKKLSIKETSEKTRLYKHQKENIEYIIKKIYKEIESLEINPLLKELIDEFFEHYLYISEQVYISFDETREKELDWLLLKHFVIPFFAVRAGQNFSFYDDRIDHGLPGGDFWYLPTYLNESKVLFPLNKVIQWLIDLYGGSNYEFYFDKKSNDYNNFSENTLKKWHKQFTIPSITTIRQFISKELKYNGIFNYHKETCVEAQFKAAIKFIESKSLSIEQLKLEVPNPNNILDRVYTETLTNNEKARFVLYIEQRWSQPTLKKIEYFLTVSRVSQSCYKELCKYFDTNEKNTMIEENKILQLSIFYAQIYNIVVAQSTNHKHEFIELFAPYISPINQLELSSKEALDTIVASIYTDLELHFDELAIDEILLITSAKNRLQNSRNLEKKQFFKRKKVQQNQQIHNTIEFIQTTKDENIIIECIYSIKDPTVLHNIGDYFEGNNYLTNKSVQPDFRLALTIHIAYSRIAQDLFHRENAYHKVLNLLTFSYYPRLLNKEDVEEWLLELNKLTDKKDFKGMLLLLVYKIYHLINQKNEKEVIIMIKKFAKITIDMKPEEYSPQVLFVAQDYMFKIGNKNMYNKLKKRNERHPKYKQHKQTAFYFYE